MSQPHPNSTSTSVFSSSADSKNGFRAKERQFIYSHGSKLHSYDRYKAPYPLSFDKSSLNLQCLDHAYDMASKLFPTDLKNNPPKRVLDLATGLGLWVISSAQAWPDATFVGYDLVDVQPRSLDPSVAERIEWVHGNLLRKRLPFENDEFDYVRIHGLALGIPENKWIYVLDEIWRVMRPGAKIEIFEEDAIFPKLPRWFTAPLRKKKHKPTISSPVETPRLSVHELSEGIENHDHELLENLFYDVFDNRFINPRPSSCLPAYFSMIFDRVVMFPAISVPMPPLPPLSPLPTANCSSSSIVSELATYQLFRLPTINVDTSLSIPMSPNPSFPPTSSRPAERSRKLQTNHDYLPQCASPPIIDDSALYLHLQRAAGLVHAVKEAIWEELAVRIKNHDEGLRKYGWESSDYCEVAGRRKFEILVEQFDSDINALVSMWHVLVQHGWEYPRQETVAKAVLMEELRIRSDIIDARRKFVGKEWPSPSRTLRLLLGTKKP